MTVRQRFKNAIKRGTGETHLLIKDNPNVDFSSDIIKIIIENKVLSTRLKREIEFDSNGEIRKLK